MLAITAAVRVRVLLRSLAGVHVHILVAYSAPSLQNAFLPFVFDCVVMSVSLRGKFGRLAIVILILGTIVILFSLSILLFMWIAPVSNPTWQLLILNNWLSNAITIFAEALKQALSFQVGLCAAMLSAIALERFAVLLPEIASCLAFRNDYNPWNAALLFWKTVPRKGRTVGVKSRSIFLLSFLLLCVGAITQVISVLLVSDIGLGQVAGFPRLNTVAYGFKYENSVDGTSVSNARRAIVSVSHGQIVATLGVDPQTSTSSTTPFVSLTSVMSLGGPVFITHITATSQTIGSTTTGGSSITAGTSTSALVSIATSSVQPSSTNAAPSSAESSASQSQPTNSETASSSQMTAGPQGWNVSPAGFAPLPDNDISAEAPIVLRKTSWSQEPLSYPAFAEYHEDPPVYETDGVDDTGRTLRAFLPYGDANTRNTLQSFSGHTAVLDARVTCQTPRIGNVSISPGNDDSMVFNGTVSSTHSTPRLFNATTIYDQSHFNPVPFSCVVPTSHSAKWHASANGSISTSSTDWYVVLCQLVNGGSPSRAQVSGGLVSEFVPMPELNDASASAAMQNYSADTGVAYLLLNITKVQDSYWGRAYGNTTTNSSAADITIPQVLHGQWLDIAYPDGTTDNPNQMVASSTLCYAGFDSANLNITMTSSTNRTEPTPKASPNNSTATSALDFSSIRTQLLGQQSSSNSNPVPTPLTLGQRGLLTLHPLTSWLTSNPQEKPPTTSYLRSAANLSGAKGSGFAGNLTLPLFDPGTQQSAWPTTADPYHVYLFQEALHAGSPAHALQALLTVLASHEFYSQLPQFTAEAEAVSTLFVAANVPVAARGLTTVVVVACVHLTVVVVVVGLFMRECRVGMVGAEWAGLLQGSRGGVMQDVGKLEALDGLRDGRVEEVLREEGKGEVRVGLGRERGNGRVQVLRREDAVDRESVVVAKRRSRAFRWLRRDRVRRRSSKEIPDIIPVV